MMHVDATLFLLPLLAGVAALLLILVLTPFAEKMQWVDRPGQRKHHREPVPMVGGLAIYLVMLAGFMLFQPPEKLAWVLFGTTLLVVVGFLDDVLELGVKLRLFVQVVATICVMVGAGLSVQAIGLSVVPFQELGVVGLIFTVFAVVGLTNAFNLVDGIDGLAAGHFLVGLGCLAGLQLLTVGGLVQSEWFIVLFSAVFAFWLVNMSLTPLKPVFLGDAGSLLVGFTMSWVLIYMTQQPVSAIEPVAALWCVTLPVFDTLAVVWRRIRRGQSPFTPDRAHLHLRMVDRGIGPISSLTAILAASVVINTFGIWLTYTASPELGLAAYGALFLLYVTMIARDRARVDVSTEVLAKTEA